MLQCKDVVRETSDYLDGDLPLFKRVGILLHIAICRGCRHYVNQVQQTIRVVSVTQPKEFDNTDTQALAMQLHAAYEKSQSDNV